ncbi:MAG: hypothetical protein LBG28_12730 [Tannerella sp.]|nr:hypothetical protein [Tannerella sp.]
MNYIKSYCRIVPGRVLLNRDVYFESGNEPFVMHDFFSAIYGRLKIEYRKFYKMDALSKLGFLASELVLDGIDRELHKEYLGIALFNRSASLEADRKYQQTIQDKNNFFPSPSDFVYTLPNIVTGEISIRNKIYGETAFYVIPAFQSDILCGAIENMIRFADMKYVLAGWIDVDAFSGAFSCMMALCETEGHDTNGTNDAETSQTYFAKRSSLMLPLNVDIMEDLWEKT